MYNKENYDESSNYFVSSYGIMKSCKYFNYYASSSNPIFNIEYYDGLIGLSPNDTIYICNTAIPHFCKNILPHISIPISIISGDSDTTTPDDFKQFSFAKEFYNSKNINHWFSQNMQMSNHPKITQIPIGLNYHTMSKEKSLLGNKMTPIEQELELCNIVRNSEPFWNRTPKIYANFHFLISTKYAIDRLNAINKIPTELIHFEPNKIKRYDTWKNQTTFAFVASPQGNGLDCHRTWEALCLGCIPIVISSTLNPLFENLPVLIIDDWGQITQKLLDDTIKKFHSAIKNCKIQFAKLSLNYWKQKINSIISIGQNDIELMQVVKNNYDNYYLQRIMEKMKQKRVVICGCGMNVAKYISANIELMYKMGIQFGDFSIIIFENNSQDNTREILLQLKKELNYKNKLHLLLGENIEMKYRPERIAYCRNKILDYVKQNFAIFDYMIVMDMDDMLYKKSPDKFLFECFANDNLKWNAQFANYMPKYYDIWAYREKGILETDCWLNYVVGRFRGLSHEWCENNYVANYSKYIHPQLPPIMVQSAFGGLGIYNLQHVIKSNSKYIGINENNQICEHVLFNKSLFANENDTKLYIQPKWIIDECDENLDNN